MNRSRVLRVRIDAAIVELPVASVRRISRIGRADWVGLDAHGGQLQVAATDHGPVIVVAAPALLEIDAVSPHPAWAVVLSEGGPLLAVAVCEVLGLAFSGESLAAPAKRSF